MINALILEDHSDMREWLVALVQDAFPNINIISVPTLEQAREQVTENVFNIALVDISLPDGSGIDFVREMSACSPDTYCVMSTIYDDDKHLFSSLQAGARGYLLKEQPREKLLGQLRGILQGEPPLSPGIARRMMQHFQKTPETANDSQLTERERDVLALVAKGLRRNEVAELMSISAHTVAGHLKNIYLKLNISTQAEAALEAVRLGLISDLK